MGHNDLVTLLSFWVVMVRLWKVDRCAVSHVQMPMTYIQPQYSERSEYCEQKLRQRPATQKMKDYKKFKVWLTKLALGRTEKTILPFNYQIQLPKPSLDQA